MSLRRLRQGGTMGRRGIGRAIFAGCLAVAALGFCPAARAGDADIIVVGNHRIDAATIKAYFRAQPDGRLDAAALDAAVKALYASRLFDDVKISREGARTVVRVTENRLIRKL